MMRWPWAIMVVMVGWSASAAARRGPVVDVVRFQPPVVGRISSGFGARVHPLWGQRRRHQGLDIAAPVGRRVLVARPGVVRFAGWRGGYGWVVEVDHGYGWTSRYAHLHQILVRPGRWVAEHGAIGRVGASGAVTGPHLHFELHYSGQPLDPLPFLLGSDRGVAPSVWAHR